MKAKLPSVGFLAVCGTYALVVAFFGWALSTPALDRVWWIDHALKTGKMRRLKPDDRTLLAGSLARHPGLGRALLGGRAIGILSENTDGWIATPTVVVLRTPESHQVTRLRLADEPGVGVFHAVRRQFLLVGRVQVARGNDLIGIDVV